MTGSKDNTMIKKLSNIGVNLINWINRWPISNEKYRNVVMISGYTKLMMKCSNQLEIYQEM